MKHPNPDDDPNNATNREQQLEQILDSALARYANAEPLSGLEDRILANLSSQPREENSIWSGWRWLAIGAASMAILLVVFFLNTPKANRFRETQTAKPGIATTPDLKTDAQSTKIGATKTHAASHATRLAMKTPAPIKPDSKRSIADSRTQPKPQRSAAPRNREVATSVVAHQPVFPSQAPLSEQERLLLRSINRTPQAVLVAMSQEQKQHEEELLEQQNQLQKDQQNELQRPIEQKSRYINQEGNSK